MKSHIFELDQGLDLEKSNHYYIFGPSKLGWYCLKGLESKNRRILGFIWSKDEESKFENLPIIPVKKLVKLPNPQVKVIVATFNKTTRQSLIDDLSLRGFEASILNPMWFITYYMLKIASRPVPEAKFSSTVQMLEEYYDHPTYRYGLINKNFYASPFVVSNVTQRCNLACYDCGQRIPYYKNGKDFSSTAVYDEVSAYCEAFDLVPEISVHGGEPMLNNDIDKIVLALSKIPNLVFINLITNSLIAPNEQQLTSFLTAGVDFHQSDYGTLTKRKASVKSLFDKFSIYSSIHFTHESEKWIRSSEVRYYSRDPSEHDEIYRSCIKTKVCAQILDGKLYRCPLSAHGGAQGLFAQIEGNDFQNLTIGNSEHIRLQIRKFFERTDHISACEFCEPRYTTLVSPAIQIKKINTTALDRSGERK